MSDLKNPPTTIRGILRQLGPGLIIAGSIVGSGELIATTAVGAEAGFVLLWLIIIGCLIKVFVQIEFGRFAITSGKTTLDGLNLVPGPKIRVNRLCWFWLIFTCVALIQLGGIIGGVGQAMAIQQPLSKAGVEMNIREDAEIQAKVADKIIERFSGEQHKAINLDKVTEQRDSARAEVAMGRKGKGRFPRCHDMGHQHYLGFHRASGDWTIWIDSKRFHVPGRVVHVGDDDQSVLSASPS